MCPQRIVAVLAEQEVWGGGQLVDGLYSLLYSRSQPVLSLPEELVQLTLPLFSENVKICDMFSLKCQSSPRPSTLARGLGWGTRRRLTFHAMKCSICPMWKLAITKRLDCELSLLFSTNRARLKAVRESGASGGVARIEGLSGLAESAALPGLIWRENERQFSLPLSHHAPSHDVGSLYEG